MSNIRSQWERLAGLAALATLHDRLEDIGSTVQGLEGRINDVRARGYAFGRGWEDEAISLRRQWSARSRDATRLLEKERRVLRSAADDAEDLLRRAQRSPALADTAENRLRELERRINEAENRINGSFDQTWNEIRQLESELDRTDFLLENLGSASFRLYPDEHAVAATDAEWMAQGSEPIKGLLFLTDGRLIFEQREEIVTKKFLFIAREKEMVQELLWQAPVGGIEVLAMEDKSGFLKARKELLTLRLEGTDGPPQVILNIKGSDNETWAQLLRRASEGQFEAERFDAPPPGT
ncbi:MAG: hypothetical protein ACP5GX_05535, partial [Anaerolineae bacterium]